MKEKKNFIILEKVSLTQRKQAFLEGESRT